MSEHELWNELGNLYFMSGTLKQAAYAYRRAIQLDGGFGRPYCNLALTYVKQGRFEEAVQLYQRSIELLVDETERAITWYRLGDVYRHLKDYRDAILAYQQADMLGAEISPEDKETDHILYGGSEVRLVQAGAVSPSIPDVVPSSETVASQPAPEAPAPVVEELAQPEPAAGETLVEAASLPAEDLPQVPAPVAEPVEAEAPVEETPVVEIAVESTFVEETVPVAEAAVEAAPVDESPAPVAEAALETASIAEAATVTEVEVETAPAEESPAAVAEADVDAAPVDEAPSVIEAEVETALVDETPAPAAEVVVEMAPIDEVSSVDEAATQAVPVDEIPASAAEAVVEMAPIDEASSVDEAATQAAPVDEFPDVVAEAAVEIAPMDEAAMVHEAAVETAPVDEAPAAEEVDGLGQADDLAASEAHSMPAEEALEAVVAEAETEPESMTAQGAGEMGSIVEEPASGVDAQVAGMAPEASAVEDTEISSADVEAVSMDETPALSEDPEDVVIDETALSAAEWEQYVVSSMEQDLEAPAPDPAEQPLDEWLPEVEMELPGAEIQEAVDEPALLEQDPAPADFSASAPEAPFAPQFPAGAVESFASDELMAAVPSLALDFREDETQPVFIVPEEVEQGFAVVQVESGTTDVTCAAESEEFDAELQGILAEIERFKRAVQANPRNAPAWDTLGTLYKAARKYRDAIMAYQQAVALDPHKPHYHHHLGILYAIEGREEDAIKAFQEVIELDPNHSLANATLGGYYRKMGLEELAQKHIGKAMKNFYTSENEYNRACLEALCGNTEQSLELLRIALKNKQTYVDWVLRDPDLDSIRRDPRFKQLISDYATW